MRATVGGTRFVALVIAGCLVAAPAIAREPTGEAALAREIGDRVAGAPVDCIDPHAVRSTRIVAGTAIVYDTGPRLYVNRPSRATSLRRDDVPLTRIDGGQLCRIDSITLLDPVTRTTRGFVVLGAFVPYTLGPAARGR